jgi:uncharacterized repeat protein (TIGR03803 family)
VTPLGAEKLIYSFSSSDLFCSPGVNLGNDGNFYGSCEEGGDLGGGVLYKATPSGTFTILHSFSGADGAFLDSPPIQATDGNFYGTTAGGDGPLTNGIVYRLTPDGTLTTLYALNGTTEGYAPQASLVQGSDGNLYGSAERGGASDCGTIFKVGTAGKLKVLHTFACTDGSGPWSAMIQGTDGRFYGTASGGGANGNGVVFRMTARGKLTVLRDLVSATDGADPYVALVQASDGNFYGVNYGGGNPGGAGQGKGSIYKVTAKGVFSTVYLFDGTVGSNPASPLVQHTNGLLYGDTRLGPNLGLGLLYSLNIGAKPFAKLAVTSGIEGTSVGIFGQGFSSATGVTFGGVSASFTTAGDHYLSATVPAGALTGPVVVKIPLGNLTSSLTFKVTPTLTTFSPTSGPVGTPVVITGTGLTQTTIVKFGGVKATSFMVNSDTQVTADVPTAAKTGKIVVTTHGGSATSNTGFTVN